MKCVYIYNPQSGKRKHMPLKNYIINKLKTKYEVVDDMPTQKSGDATLFARNACGKYDTIVVAGGDGTLNEVINGIAENENRPKIGYIPTGTTNDLANSLKIPKKIKKAVNVILENTSTKRDIFKVNDKYGIYVCAFGIFTSASYAAKQSDKNKFGKLAYYFSGIKEIDKINKFPIKIKSENLEFSTDIILGIISNGKYVSGYKIDSHANCSDGIVNVILFKEKRKKRISLKTLLAIFNLFLFGITSIKKVKDCYIIPLSKFSVTLNDDTNINIDGENGHQGSFNFEVLNNHLEIFVKQKLK
jgi:diacylglycerol kinase (ATP)